MALLELDDLTRAYRRDGLDTTLAHLFRESAGTATPLALAVLDVDHFKSLNDAHGHAVGDAVLSTVVARMTNALRNEDLVFRYGGDEFVALLPDTPHDEAEAVMRRVVDRVTASPIEAGPRVRVRVSVGLAVRGDGGEDADPQALFARADARLYLAKRAGRNRVVADDEAREPEGPSEVRLLGRDGALAHLDAFLAGEATTPAARVLHLTGPRGAGFTRLLHEAAVRGRQLGRTVRVVTGDATYEEVHLRALQLAYGSEVAPDVGEAELADLTGREASGPGLVVALEGGRHLDPASRALLAGRLAQPGTHLIEAVPDGEDAAFTAGRRQALTPLGEEEVGRWLSAALGGPLDPACAAALHRAGQGRPGPIARVVRASMSHGTLRVEDGAVLLDPAEVERHAAEMRPAGHGTVRLPNWSTPLVGRTGWLEEVDAQAAEARMVTLTGPGGAGKSRLAAQLARQWAPGAPGGTDWVDLRAARPGDALIHAIAESVGLDPTEDPGELAAALGQDPRRLVLDEIDALADQAGVLQEILERAPSLRLLISARRPLRLPEERVSQVPELSEGSALELFRQGMARAGAPDSSDEALRPVLNRIGTSPLSVELAAAWTGALAPAELAHTLDHRPALLADMPDQRARSERAIDVTRNLMSPAEREALGTLSLIPAGFEPAEAEAAAEASPFFLLALLERSLLRREGHRYTVHAAIAERFRAGLQDWEAARARVADAYVQVARRLDGLEHRERTERGYAVADRERPNLVMAWHANLDRRPPDPMALWPLARLLRGYLDVRGRSREGLALFSAADAALQDHEDAELRGWVRECMALFLAQRGRLDEAETRITEALAILAPDGSRDASSDTAAMAWNTAGLVRGHAGRLREAVSAFETAARMRRARGDAVGEAQARGNVALALVQLERPSEAQGVLEAAIRRYREVNHASGLALSLVTLAGLLRRSGEEPTSEAVRVAREGFDLAEAIGYAHGAVLGARELGEALAAADRRHEAAAAFERARHWAQEADDRAAEQDAERALSRVVDG